MPTTAEALLVTLLFIAPGLLFELGIEREIGYWRTGIADRTLRFFATSTVFHTLAAPATFALWRAYLVDDQVLARVGALPWPLWGALFGYLIAPLALGTLVARRAQAGSRWVWPIIGRDPAPKAWDSVFGQPGRHRYVRAKLAEGGWVGGLWTTPEGAPGAYASSFPHGEDLYLPLQVDVDPRTGAVLLDAHGRPQVRQWGLLIERSKVELIEVQDIAPPAASEKE